MLAGWKSEIQRASTPYCTENEHFHPRKSHAFLHPTSPISIFLLPLQLHRPIHYLHAGLVSVGRDAVGKGGPCDDVMRFSASSDSTRHSRCISEYRPIDVIMKGDELHPASSLHAALRAATLFALQSSHVHLCHEVLIELPGLMSHCSLSEITKCSSSSQDFEEFLMGSKSE